MKVLVSQSCPTLCDPMDYSLPDSSVHGILQARVLEWVAISFSRGCSRPRDWTWVSCVAGRLFYHLATWWLRDDLKICYLNFPYDCSEIGRVSSLFHKSKIMLKISNSSFTLSANSLKSSLADNSLLEGRIGIFQQLRDNFLKIALSKVLLWIKYIYIFQIDFNLSFKF